ncbi:MAG: cytochrome c biogenesis protein CcdA [Clostridia bacterium]|nr:cytochrome c biogenesis protein CcdA [Clostridia bacterium]
MNYFITFLEGIITFISPCILPMIPIYVSYFATGKEPSTKKTLKNALGFVLGFTVVFVLLGALAGTLGRLLQEYQSAVNIISGSIVIIFGLNYIGVFKLKLFGGIGSNISTRELGFFSAMLFGIIFSVGWTPCVGAFLGSALALASREGEVLSGVVMLLLYSLGLGIPFIASAVLIDRLKSTFNFIKKNYRIINIVCGSFLIVVGLFMMTGTLGRLLALLS